MSTDKDSKESLFTPDVLGLLAQREAEMRQGKSIGVVLVDERFVEGLRARGQLLETNDEDITLPPGITHLLIKRPGKAPELKRVRFN